MTDPTDGRNRHGNQQPTNQRNQPMPQPILHRVDDNKGPQWARVRFDMVLRMGSNANQREYGNVPRLLVKVCGWIMITTDPATTRDYIDMIESDIELESEYSNTIHVLPSDIDYGPYGNSWPNTVSRRSALREIIRHSIDPQEFVDECGNHERYPRETVLNWLGY